MKKNNTYLTIEEKKELILAGKPAPVCVGDFDDKNRDGFVCKIRSIWNGDLKNKNMKL